MKIKSINYKEILGKLKDIKNIEVIIAIVIIAIIVSIYSSTLSKPNNNSKPNANSVNNTNEGGSIQDTKDESNQIEEKLRKTLSAMEGVGKVEVMITYESGPEVVTAVSTEKQDTSTEESDSNGGKRITQSSNEHNQPVTIQQSGGSQPLVLKEKQPEVRGVIIVAEGADDIRVRMNLLKAAQTVLKISPDKVDVFPMEINE